MMMGMVHSDDTVHGSLRLKGAWSIVMRRVMEPCDEKSMRHSDDMCHGAL